MSRPAPEQVKRALAQSAPALAEALIPHGKIDGSRLAKHREWHGKGPDGAKWGIVIAGPKCGRWQNFGSGEGGNSLLSLIRDACCQGDHIAAYHWALDWLGDDVVRTLPRAAPDEAGPPPPRGPVRRAVGNGAKLYAAGAPMRDWTGPVGQYLEQRGILWSAFNGRPITALRYLPDCWNVEANCGMPAILAPVTDPQTGVHLATHRTYLAYDGGAWRKAAVATPKKVLGSFAGGIIRLRDGAGLVLAEGIENALSVAVFFPELGAASYVAAGNLANLTLPKSIQHVVLVRDRDGLNAPIEAARQHAVLRWADQLRQIDIWEPPAGCHDANDYLRQVLRGEREE